MFSCVHHQKKGAGDSVVTNTAMTNVFVSDRRPEKAVVVTGGDIENGNNVVGGMKSRPLLPPSVAQTKVNTPNQCNAPISGTAASAAAANKQRHPPPPPPSPSPSPSPPLPPPAQSGPLRRRPSLVVRRSSLATTNGGGGGGGGTLRRNGKGSPVKQAKANHHTMGKEERKEGWSLHGRVAEG
jgi:hypothetical protein